MKKTILLTALLLISLCLGAQEPKGGTTSWELNYTTEGLYNVSNGLATWVNILEAGFEQEFSHGFSFSMGLLSVNNVRSSQGRSGIADNLHIFSAIEDASVPLCLNLFGLTKRFGPVSLFVGVRNLNVDYFTTPWNSVFTSSVNGLYPCISANYPLADAPCSAMALQADIDLSPRWLLKASLYNGVASEKWDEAFRFRPERDGVFVISELSYTGDGNDMAGNYSIGGIWGNTYIADAGRKEVRRTLWTLIEQPLWRNEAGRQVELVLHGGLAPECECDTYFGGGALWRGVTAAEDYIGVMYTRTLHSLGNESAYELTYAYPVGPAVLQTALHYVHTPHHDNFIGMIKMVFSL